MPSFLEILFPPSVLVDLEGGPMYDTDVIRFNSGQEQRIQKRENGIMSWNVAKALQDPDDAKDLVAFFRTVRGKAFGFRLHDWSDFELDQEPIGVGDGVTTVYTISKVYGFDGSNPETRRIYKIASPAFNVIGGPFTYTDLIVRVDGVVKAVTTHYTLDINTGTITFLAAPALSSIIDVTGQFHVPARFDIDQMRMVNQTKDLSSWPTIPIVEITNPLL